ncbi:cupin domain-containing protein [[Eubacterium] cellulosolvens]
MNDFPSFMKNKSNLIDAGSQYTDDIEGYVFDGLDGSQMAFWTCYADRISREHTHEYDEYIVVVQGQYTVKMDSKIIVMNKGDEILIPKGTTHSGSNTARTRIICAFGGRRAERSKI